MQGRLPRLSVCFHQTSCLPSYSLPRRVNMSSLKRKDPCYCAGVIWITGSPPRAVSLLPPDKLLPFMIPFRGGSGSLCGGAASAANTRYAVSLPSAAACAGRANQGCSCYDVELVYRCRYGCRCGVTLILTPNSK